MRRPGGREVTAAKKKKKKVNWKQEQVADIFGKKKKDALMEISMSQTIKSVYFIIISSDFSVPIFRSF